MVMKTRFSVSKKYATWIFMFMSPLLVFSSFLFLKDKNPPVKSPEYLFNDCHFHLTNYIQEGTTAKDHLALMADKVGRSTLFGIPLQQQWSYRVNGENAPTYYLDTDAPLYYYSFTDAYIAMQYKSLSP